MALDKINNNSLHLRESIWGGEDRVEVWSGNQNQPPEWIAEFYRSLSTDERARASRFKFERDRVHFITARGMLRYLLAAYMDIVPAEVQFRYNKQAKPHLSEEWSGLRFNISHSGGKVLLAFALDRELGVDVEQIRPDFATDDVAERFFSALEVEKLRLLPKSAQARAFFNCWTRKEAFIKAIGEGLSCPLDKFDVTLAPEEPARLLATRIDGQPASNWSMQSLEVGTGYRAALVVQGHGWKLSLRKVGEIIRGCAGLWLSDKYLVGKWHD